jgi:hypothetical protein
MVVQAPHSWDLPGIKQIKATKSADAQIQGKANQYHDIHYKIEHSVPGVTDSPL